MKSTDEPLLRQSQPSSAGVVSEEHWNGRINGDPATLNLHPDGSCLLEQDTKRTILCCIPSFLRIKIPSLDLVGATLETPQSLQLWYMPLRKSSIKTKPIRVVRKTPIFTLPSPSTAAAALQAIRRAACPSPRRILAIINPVSGPGTAPKLYQTKVKPILEAAGLKPTDHVTSGPGQATTLVKNASPDELDVVMTVGGDGTTFEALQGLLDRPDWRTMSEAVALLQVPGGSGNALAASVGLWDVATAAYAAVKGVVQPLDVASVVQPGQKRLFSFLSVTYGLIACLDIGTEHMRWMGSTRFVVGAVQQVMSQQTFRLRVAIVGKDGGGGGRDGSEYGHHSDENGRYSGGELGLSKRAPATAPAAAAAASEPTEGSTRPPPAAQHDARADAAPPNSHPQRGFDIGFGPPLRFAHDFQAFLPPPQAQPTAAAPMLDGAVLPSRWQHVPVHEVQLFAACNLPRLDMNFNFSPASRPGDGHWNLIYTSGRSGRLRGLEVLNASEAGNHIDMKELVAQRRLMALAIEPLEKQGKTWLVVDGEQVPHLPLFAEVHPGLCNVIGVP